MSKCDNCGQRKALERIRRNMRRKSSVMLVLQELLAFIAGYIAYRIFNEQNAWAFIVAYWLVLTVKNFVEVIR